MNKGFFDSALRKRLWVGILLVLGLVFLLSAMRYLRPEEEPKPVLALMTTLPLQWSEGGIEAAIDAEAKPHPVFERLSQQYAIRSVDDFSRFENDGVDMALLAQPRALSPAELVQLDAWVRQGGRLLVLADPALQWGSLYSIGDKRRPLFTSLLSPLFSHWGVELVLPITGQERLTVRDVSGFTLRSQTLGEWVPKEGAEQTLCQIKENRLVADCAIGKGRAVLVADADLLDAAYWQGEGVVAIVGSDAFGNMIWIESLLQSLSDQGL